MVLERPGPEKEIRLSRSMVEELDAMLSRCVLRLQASPAPDGRALGAEAEGTLLDLEAAVARYDKKVALHGGEGRRPVYVEPEPAPSSDLRFMATEPPSPSP